MIDAGAPAVTVVVPVFGARMWTDRAIHALRAGTASDDYELIVVDNASPDGTAGWLEERHPGLRVVRNQENRGFGAASNQGADLARGEFVAFLNSDAVVHDGWLDALRAAMGDPTVGAVGPMFLGVDGSVQEAGAMCWRDGNTAQIGRGRSPDDAEVTFARTVDYISGACLMLRTDDFRAIGGFDPAFRLAYCEDVDLCLRLAAVGLRARYVPAARVTHKAGASRDADWALRLFRRNRHLFAARHAVALAGRPTAVPHPSPARLALARDAIAEARVLVVGQRGSPVARAVLAAIPEARVTLAGAPYDAARRDLNDLGLEVVPAVTHDRWLAARRYQLDMVVGVGEVEPVLWNRILSTQPQALIFADPPIDPEELVAALGLRSRPAVRDLD